MALNVNYSKLKEVWPFPITISKSGMNGGLSVGITTSFIKVTLNVISEVANSLTTPSRYR